jgi:hypothetical protein
VLESAACMGLTNANSMSRDTRVSIGDFGLESSREGVGGAGVDIDRAIGGHEDRSAEVGTGEVRG